MRTPFPASFTPTRPPLLPELAEAAGADLLVSDGLAVARRLAAQRDHAGLLRLSRLCPAARRDAGVMMAAARVDGGATVLWGWPHLSAGDRQAVVVVAARSGWVGLVERLISGNADLLQTAFVAAAANGRRRVLQRLMRHVPSDAWVAAAMEADASVIPWIAAHSPSPLARIGVQAAWAAKADLRLVAWLGTDLVTGLGWLTEMGRFSDEAERDRLDAWLSGHPSVVSAFSGGITTTAFPRSAALAVALGRRDHLALSPNGQRLC